MLPTLVFSQIIRIRPTKSVVLVPGEINFQWKRAEGDKSPVTIEVRNKETNKLVLERRTIGTRRTKSLDVGEYEWRIYNNSKILDTSWHTFFVKSRGIWNTNKEVTKKIIKPISAPVLKIQEEKENTEVEENSKTIKNPVIVQSEISAEQYYEIVKKYLKNKTKKPETLEFLEWFAPEKQNASVLVRVRFRALNSFKELKENDMLFYIENKNVAKVKNLSF